MGNVRISGDGSTIYEGLNVNTPYASSSDQGVKVDDFLQLMIAQLTNQDFMNPVDDTQYVTQLAQFASMQAMKEMNYYSQTSYATGLVGKSVTVAALGLGGQVNKDSGIVSAVSLNGEKYLITVNGKQYELSQIMNVSTPGNVTQNALDAASKLIPITQSVDNTSIKIRWDAPVDDPNGELRYDVYITDNASLDMDSLAGVKKATIDGESLRTSEHTFTGLEAGKTYFINVIVRNAAGDASVYQHTAVTTKA